MTGESAKQGADNWQQVEALASLSFLLSGSLSLSLSLFFLFRVLGFGEDAKDTVLEYNT